MKLIEMRFLRFFFVSLCLLFDVDTYTSFAQLKDIMNVPSPEVASMGMFGNTPVGYFTGTPNISIPLYELQINKSLTLPISADYHPANVKPHNPPTTLGIGWVLNSGGYIARTVKGVCDEMAYYVNGYSTAKGLSNKGFLYNYSELRNCVDNNIPPGIFYDNYEAVDLSADEFSFNFMGHQGTFFLDMYGNWQVCSDENIKVEFNPDSDIIELSKLKDRIYTGVYDDGGRNVCFIIRFTLITSDGTRYTFGGVNATEFCIPYYGQKHCNLVSSCWRLSKIQTLDNHVITFDYATDGKMCDVRYAPQYIKDTMLLDYGQYIYLYDPISYINKDVDDRYVYKIERDSIWIKGYSGVTLSKVLREGKKFINISGAIPADRKVKIGDDFVYVFGCNLDLLKNTCVAFGLQITDGRHNVKEGVGEFCADNNTEYFGYSGFLSMPVRLCKITSESETLEFNYERDVNYGNQFYNGSNSLYHVGMSDWSRLSGGRKGMVHDENDMYAMFGLLPDNYRKEREMQQLIAEKLMCYYLKNICVKNDSYEKLLISFNIDIDKSRHHALLKEISFGCHNDLRANVDKNSFESGGMQKTYKFKYYNEGVENLLWPGVTPKIYTDSWGYYNSVINGGQWKIPVDVKGYSCIRVPNLASTKTYVLKEIVYPTGGSSVYEYELNDYSKVFDVNKGMLCDIKGYSGGLRVCAISDYDMSGELMSKRKFSYEENGESSGISRGLPLFYNKTCYNSYQWEEVYSTESVDTYPMNFNSPDVAYSSVTENVYDKDNQLRSKTRYTFTNYDSQYASLSKGNGHIDEAGEIIGGSLSASTCVTPFTSYAFERGKLSSKEIYNERNELMEKDTYNYSWSSGGLSVVFDETYHSLIWLKYGVPCIFFDFSLWHKYNVLTNRYLVASEKKEVRYGDDFVNREKNYIYNDYKMLSMECNGSISSEDNWESITYLYTYDYYKYKSLTDMNILLPVMTEKKRSNCVVRNTKTYSTTSKGIPYISKETKYTKYGSNSAEDVSYEVTQVDEYGNPVAVREKGLCSYIYWGYNGMKPIAVMSMGIIYEALSPSNILDDFKEIVNKFNKDGDANAFDDAVSVLRQNCPNVMIRTYTYEPATLYLKEATDKNGLKTCYAYDNMGRLISVFQKSGSVLSEKERYRYNYYNQSESSKIKW